ncbi:hypothetical protein HYX19_02650 [Candidatus Woesearchaeota archaeon]|nr:hypothetical protein [Candidatus Woesearchaeota archaeon]
MKKATILGLAGLLSIVGANSSALETKEDGYEILDVKNAKLFHRELTRESPKVEVNIYLYPTEIDEIPILKILIDNKPFMYAAKKDTYKHAKEAVYFLADNNCDGIFETKYTNEEMENMKEEDIPACYLK